jgi:pimeloyl-ACP methyl ester carboxylesterase
VLLAARHPLLVAGLVLAAPVGRTNQKTPWLREALAWPMVGEVTSAFRLFATRWLYPGARHDPSMRIPGLWRTTASERRFLLQEIDSLEASLPDVTIPTVVVTGAIDDVVPPSVAVRTAAKVADTELVVVPGAGHALPRDAPDVIVSAVRSVELKARATGRWDRQGVGYTVKSHDE